MFFAQMGIVKSRVISGVIKFKVQFPYCQGDVWLEEDDYNKAGSIVRDCFRN